MQKSSIKGKEISLDNIIGLNIIKKQVKRLVSYMNKNKENISSRHMVFLGNPGTGKTTVARCLANELYKHGIIKKNIFIETDRGGLVAAYVGQTALKTKNMFKKARGGILFIDEAYALTSSKDETGRDYGFEALSTLIKEMEDNRDSTIVIFAGYPKEMESMLSANPGMNSRIQFHLDFPDYSLSELEEIFVQMIKNYGYSITKEAQKRLLLVFEMDKKSDNFSNGRYIRNLVEKIILIQSERTEDYIITIDDVQQYILEQPLPAESCLMGFC